MRDRDRTLGDVCALSLAVTEAWLDGAWSERCPCPCPCPLSQWPLRIPPDSKYSMILSPGTRFSGGQQGGSDPLSTPMGTVTASNGGSVLPPPAGQPQPPHAPSPSVSPQGHGLAPVPCPPPLHRGGSADREGGDGSVAPYLQPGAALSTTGGLQQPGPPHRLLSAGLGAAGDPLAPFGAVGCGDMGQGCPLVPQALSEQRGWKGWGHFGEVPAWGFGVSVPHSGESYSPPRTPGSQRGAKRAGDGPWLSPNPGGLVLPGPGLCHLLPGPGRGSTGDAAPISVTTRRGQQVRGTPHTPGQGPQQPWLLLIGVPTQTGTYRVPTGGFQERQRVPAPPPQTPGHGAGPVGTHGVWGHAWPGDTDGHGPARGGDTALLGTRG